VKNICLLCRGGKRLCGKLICPIELKAKLLIKNMDIINKKEFIGSSPPSVFVGRIGYPKVYIGPMVPPITGDTSIMDMPELWINESLENIVNYRYILIRGEIPYYIDSVRKSDRVIESLQELSMGISSVDTEIQLAKEPSKIIKIDDNSQIFGPSAPLKNFHIYSIRVDRKIEKTYYDWDLKAQDAIFQLYKNNVPISRIQKAFSMGVFGILKNRRLVPTRWSITAVDSIISKKLIEEIKDYDTIDNYYLFYRNYMYNKFIAIFMPMKWSFEWIEVWFPNTFWNKEGREPVIMGDYEGYSGRTSYPEIGGCYFATRLAITEYLSKIKRQATVLVIREILPQFPLPLGVWFVRENIREMLKSKPLIFDNINSIFLHLNKLMDIKNKDIIENSKIIRDLLFQRRIDKL
jgi:hypothetical protein